MTEERETTSQKAPMPRAKAWGVILGSVLFLWVFAMYLGPWMQKQIPTFDKIVDVIIEKDIDSGAYLYTEIKGSYEGESYLTNALRYGDGGKFWGLTWPFAAGIVLCIAILFLGYCFLPNEHIPDPLMQNKEANGT